MAVIDPPAPGTAAAHTAAADTAAADIATAGTASAALTHVLARLAVLEQRAHAKAGGADKTGKTAIELLAAAEAAADTAEDDGVFLPLRDLSSRLGLSHDEVDLLLAAASPALDPDVADLLDPTRGPNGDVRADVVLKRLGLPAIAAHRLLDPDGPLRRPGLVQSDQNARLTVPRAVVEHLLVLPRRPSEGLAASIAPAGQLANDDAQRLTNALRAGMRFVYLQDALGGVASAVASAAAARCGLDVLHLDLSETVDTERLDAILDEALVRAYLDGLAITAGPTAHLNELADRLARLASGDIVLMLYGAEPWRPSMLSVVPWQLSLAPATKDERVLLWQQAVLGAIDLDDVPTESAIADGVGHLHLAPPAVHRAVLSASLQAIGDGHPLDIPDLVRAAQAQSGAALQRLAKRITPAVGWDDIVLPDAVRQQLEDVCTRARHRDLVLGTWQVGGGSSRKRGTVALFGGPPGTGKSLAAEVVGGVLGLEVYQVNLATVVDKYVGETEKNLDRIFRAAEGVNCLLFFDEADALFGKRSEVKDAQDKYANVEVAYLLQRLEDFDGVAVLASNLRGNLDDAFKRRIDVLVDFPLPDEAARVLLWRTCLGTRVELAPDVDFEALAKFELAGGDIRNVTVGAAMTAASTGEPISMAQLLNAIQAEYRKMGRLVDPAAFAKKG